MEPLSEVRPVLSLETSKEETHFSDLIQWLISEGIALPDTVLEFLDVVSIPNVAKIQVYQAFQPGVKILNHSLLMKLLAELFPKRSG